MSERLTLRGRRLQFADIGLVALFIQYVAPIDALGEAQVGVLPNVDPTLQDLCNAIEKQSCIYKSTGNH